MFWRILLILFLVKTAVAQVPAVRSVPIDTSLHSLIIKFRTPASANDPIISATLRSISATSPHSIFPHNTKSNNSILSIDTFGFDRIVQIPLRTGISASSAVQQLAGLQGIEYVEPNYHYHIQSGEHIPNDSLFSSQWWLQAIHAPQAWTITEGDSSIHLGFVDEGANFNHPDLKFQFAVNPAEDRNRNGLFDPWPSDSLGVDARGDTVYGDLDGIDHNGNGYVNDVIGYDFTADSPIPFDAGGHGTAIAGIMAAEQDNHVGISGVAPKCKLVALKAFDETGTGEDVNIARAIVYAADNGVQVLNCSFGDIIPSLLQRDAIRYAISKGVIIFGSSGNSGGSGSNYPSDFDEVVSVGGTTEHGLYPFTTHGAEMDCIAPGNDVLTTTIDGSYAQVSGTSASSAVASGIAALLLSKDPKLTPLEVRSIMESTTQAPEDRSLASNGALDAYQALSYLGSAQIKIVSPHTLDEFHIGDTIPILGYAMSTLFTGYSLSWQKDYSKDSLVHTRTGNYYTFYDSVVGKEFDTSNSQVWNGTLGRLDTHGFDTGTYTIILAVGSSDNRSTQERCNIYVTRSKPKFVEFKIDSIWVNNVRGILLQATSDIPVQFDVRYQTAGAKPSAIADDNIAFEHSILLQQNQTPAGVPFSVHAELVTPNGDTTSLDTIAFIPNEAIPSFDPSHSEVAQGGFQQQPYSLPGGFPLDSVFSLPVGDEVIENQNSSNNLTVYRFDSSKMTFVAIDSVRDSRIPQWIGNSQGSGGPELIVEDPLIPNCAVYKGNGSHSILGSIVFTDTNNFGSTFARFNPSAPQEIITVIDSAWQAFQFQNGSYSILGTGTNVSQPDYYDPNNVITYGNVRSGDFLGTGAQEIAVLDNDADLMIYRKDSSALSGFRSVYLQSNNAASSGSLLAVGDFDGDGKPDIAYAYHPVEEQDTLDEYHVAYWTLMVLRNRGNFAFDTMYIDRFYGNNRDEHFFIGGPSGSLERITNITGHTVDDLAVSFFPNFYLLEYDSITKTMHPIWNYPSQEYRAISWDFDKNGKRELGIYTGDSIHFFERTSDYGAQTPAPTGLMVTPRDTNRVDLSWAPVIGATTYYILRASVHDLAYSLVDSTSSTHYSDTTVQNGDTLIYSVAAIDPSYLEPQSVPAFGIEVIVHPMPHLESASLPAKNIVRVRTSQRPSAQKIFAGTIMVDDSIQSTAITSSKDSEVVMELGTVLSPGPHRMRVTSFNLRDFLNSPFDTSTYLLFEVPIDTTRDHFYIVRWTFDQGPNGLQIHVIFNEEPGQSALNISNYTLTPYGTLTGITRDTSNSNALYIDVSGVQLRALGVPYVLCISGIESILNTPLDPSNGNCVGISLTQPDLSSVFTYPNPAKQSEGQLMFAGLTSNATIRIYSIRMKPIRELSVQNSQGGIVWDLRDDTSKPVPSGEYLFYVTGSTETAQSVEGVARKLVIVNDQ